MPPPQQRGGQAVPEGWRLVPVEPTEEMLEAAMDASCLGRPSADDDSYVRSIIGAMLTSAPPAPSVGGWQDIASAPKDGSVVLLWLRSPWSEPRIAYWYEPWGNWQPQGYIPDAIEDEVSGIGADVPIAWAPLPQPPKEKP